VLPPGSSSATGRECDIQYWFFYPYNGPFPVLPWFGNQEGDWEHVTVRVSNWWQGLNRIANEAFKRGGE
jgi:Vacuolar protein sorting-associated protein 62